MKIQPLSINGHKLKEFNGCKKEDMTVIVGGYIITPLGEIIEVKDNEEHCNVFSEYINGYLETGITKTYDIYPATKILCELGCCVYAGVRYEEYISKKSGSSYDVLASLSFPNDIERLSTSQKEICSYLISINKSSIGNKEKINIQYGSFPDNVYSKEEILNILSKERIDEKGK